MKTINYAIVSLFTVIALLLAVIGVLVLFNLKSATDLGYYKGKTEVYEAYSTYIESKTKEEDKVLEGLKNVK